MDNVELASLIVHEMFHCMQFVNGEKRFPNELLGMDYPITVENINLRTRERLRLLNAVLQIDIDEKMESLSKFFSIRKKRENLIGEAIEYEKAVETVEGTAVYVEYKAYEQLTNDNKALKKYTSGFSDISEENLKVRYSSYKQGLLLGILADNFISDWKKKFIDSKLYLSDFILSELDVKETTLDNTDENLGEIEKCVADWAKKRDLMFEEFEKRIKINSLEEGFKITGFDPMNVEKRNQEVIHKNFLRVARNNSEQIIKGPVKTIIGDHIFDVKRIEW